jgi:hypothetical protein
MSDPNMIDCYKTIKLNNINTKKRINFKTFQYQKRLHYGRLETLGFLNSEMRLIPNPNNNLEITFDAPSNYNTDDNILNKLNYCADLLVNIRESKREIKLKKMLLDKLTKLSRLKKEN